MSIDVLFLLFMVLAVFRGVRHGFIISVCSAIAIFIGLAAAIRLSASVAASVSTSAHLSYRWLPVLTFILIFVGVVILVRLGARMLEKAVDLAMMGWLNKLGGIILYLFIYLFVYSIFLFYLTKMNFIKKETISVSHTYSLIEPFGPKAIDMIGSVVPVFKNIFHDLTDFFEKIAANNA